MNIFSETWHWFLQSEHWLGSDGIFVRFQEHLYYSLVSIFIAALIAIPIGIFFGFKRKGAFVIINLFNIGKAVPPLGLILLCIILFSINDAPIFITLVALSIPPILTNCYLGIYQTDQQLYLAAQAMGMTPTQSLFQLRIPLALPYIFAGLRTALLQLISAAMIAAYAGLGGLGRFLIDGLGQRDYAQIIAGSIIVSLLAIGCEIIFSYAEKRFFHEQAPN